VHFPRFLHIKTKLFAVKFRCIFELSTFKVYKNVLGAFSQFLRSKMKLFAMKFRRILEVFTLQGNKSSGRSCFLLSLDGFWKILPCKVYEKSSGCIFTIFTSKIKVVCWEVQTHFGSSLLQGLQKKVLDKIELYMCPKMKWFAVKCRRILWVFCLQGLQKIPGAFSQFMSPKLKLFAVKFRCILEVLWLVRFVKKVLNAFSWFFCPKTKLFTIGFRWIL